MAHKKYLILRSPNSNVHTKKISYFFLTLNPTVPQKKTSFENRKQFWFDVIIFKASNILEWRVYRMRKCLQCSEHSKKASSLNIGHILGLYVHCTYMIYHICTRCLLRFEYQLPHPILCTTLATDKK